MAMVCDRCDSRENVRPVEIRAKRPTLSPLSEVIRVDSDLCSVCLTELDNSIRAFVISLHKVRNAKD